jgi:hypothetical protein
VEVTGLLLNPSLTEPEAPRGLLNSLYHGL